MGGLKELFEKIGKSINSDELIDLANNNTLAELKLDDELVTSIETKFNDSRGLSIDAAKNNPDLEAHFKNKLRPTIKGEILGNLDTDILQNAKKLFGDDAAKSISELERTGEKLAKFASLAEDMVKSSAKDGKLKEVNEALQKQMGELSKEWEKKLTDKEKEIKKIQTGFTQTLIDTELNKELSTYKLGEDYEKDFVKKALFADLKEKINKKAKLVRDENGQIIPKNPENVEMNLFIESKEIKTLKELIEPEIKPFLKKTSGDTKPDSYKPVKDEGNKSRLAQDLIEKRKAQTMY